MKTLRFIGLALLSCTLLFVSCKKTKQYTITVTVNDVSMGSATGGGVYDENATITLSSTANPNFRFVKWEDGNTDNPRTITVTKNETYTAMFEVAQTGITVSFGAEQWTAGEFMVDASIYESYGKLRFYVFKTSSADQFPQFQGEMPNSIGTTTLADLDRLVYVGSAEELDAQGNVQWKASSLQTEITAIDLNNHSISAVQIGEMRNQQTSETRSVKIQYNNITWIPISVPSK